MAYDKLVDSAQLDADLTSVADAIRAKSGGSSSLAFPSGFVSEVGNISTGITPSGTKSISITENGTTTEDVTNYANAEIIVNVSEGSDSYDWSWVKNDGNTYLYIEVGDYWKDYKLRYYQTSTAAITVNWGDGDTETTSTRDTHTLTHTYAAAGSYTISISPTNDNLAFYAHINNGSATTDRPINNMLVKAEIGRCSINTNVLLDKCNRLTALAYMGSSAIDTSQYSDLGTQLCSLAHYKQSDMSKIYGVQGALIEDFPYNSEATALGSFMDCLVLKSAKIPKGASSVPGTCFQNCAALAEVVFETPASATAINGSCFARCYSLKAVTIPEGMTTLGVNFFYACTGLEYVGLPSTLTSIPAGWTDCKSLKELHIAATTPPTLGGTYFSTFPSGWVLYVPYSADHSVLAAYQAETNWSTYASNMQEEPQ